MGLFTGAAPALGGPEGAGRPEARSLHHDLMGPVGEAIEGAVGEDRVVEEGDPLLDGAVARDGRGRPTMAFDEDVVEVAGLLGRELPKPEIVHDEEIPGEPAAELPLEGVVGARGMKGVQKLGGLDVADGMTSAAGGVAEGLGEVALPDADRAREDHVLL